MIIALPSKQQDEFSATMRRRLDAVLYFLRWSATISVEPSPWSGPGCRFRVERAAWEFAWTAATYVIDAVPRRRLVEDKALSRQLLLDNKAGTREAIYGVMSESTVVEQMAANLHLLAVARVQPHCDEIMGAIWEEELLPGQTMTRGVLEARLLRRGFSKAAVTTNVSRMIGEGDLAVDLNRPITAGSLIWRRSNQVRLDQYALPWRHAQIYR